MSTAETVITGWSDARNLEKRIIWSSVTARNYNRSILQFDRFYWYLNGNLCD